MDTDETGKWTGTTPPKVVKGPLPEKLPDLVPRRIPVAPTDARARTCEKCGSAINSCGHSAWNVTHRKLNDGSGMSVAECYECKRPKSESNSVTEPIDDRALEVAREIYAGFEQHSGFNVDQIAALVRKFVEEATEFKRKENAVLLDKVVEFKEENAELQRNLGHCEKRNAELIEENAELRERVRQLEEDVKWYDDNCHC